MAGLFEPAHLLLVLIIVLVLFGGKKIPELMRGVGLGIREFRRASSEAVEDLKKAADLDERPDETRHTG
jgi:sec-independent protein translocase protein TatA